MNSTPSGLAIVALHTGVIYLFLLVAFRVGGQRRLGQLNVVDFASILLLGSAVETAMVNANTSLEAGLVSAGTLLILNRGIALIATRFSYARQFCTHGILLLVHNGTLLEENMRRMGLTYQDVIQALRERSVQDLSDVKFATMEANGSITVVPIDHPVMRSKTPQSKGFGSQTTP